MAQITIANVNLDVTEEGYLTVPSQWTESVAKEIAKEFNIELTEEHFKVINFLRKDYEDNGKLPTMRRIKKVGGVPTKDLYRLFPKAR